MWAYEWWKGQFWGGFQPQTAKKRWRKGDTRCEAGDGSCNPPCKGWLLGLCLYNVSLGHSALKAASGSARWAWSFTALCRCHLSPSVVGLGGTTEVAGWC